MSRAQLDAGVLPSVFDIWEFTEVLKFPNDKYQKPKVGHLRLSSAQAWFFIALSYWGFFYTTHKYTFSVIDSHLRGIFILLLHESLFKLLNKLWNKIVNYHGALNCVRYD